MSRLPTPGGDSGNWGVILNDYLGVAHESNGALKPIASSKVTDFNAAASAASPVQSVDGQMGAVSLTGTYEPAGAVVAAQGLLGTTATVPPANSRLFEASTAGRAMAWRIGQTGPAEPLGRPLWAGVHCMAAPDSGATIRANGSGSVTSAGTVTHPTASASRGLHAQVATAATAAAVAYVAVGGSLFIRRSDAMTRGGWFATARLYFPDANYNETGATSGSRIAVGFYGTSLATMLGADRGGTQALSAFMRTHVNGGAQDANWQFVTNDGTSATTADTTMPFTLQHEYDFWQWAPAGGSSIMWRIDDLTAGTTASGVATQTLPVLTKLMTSMAGISTIDATARTFQFTHVYGESDKAI